MKTLFLCTNKNLAEKIKNCVKRMDIVLAYFLGPSQKSLVEHFVNMLLKDLNR